MSIIKFVDDFASSDGPDSIWKVRLRNSFQSACLTVIFAAVSVVVLAVLREFVFVVKKKMQLVNFSRGLFSL